MRELDAIGAPFVVVDRSEAVARELSRDHGCVAVVGDATHDEVLEEAGIERARGVISALTDDKDNLYVTVTARALNPTLRIVAKAIDPRAEAKLRRAGRGRGRLAEHDRRAAARLRDAPAGGGHVPRRHAPRQGPPLRIEEIPVPGVRRGRAGAASATSTSSRHKLLLLAVKEPGGGEPRIHYNPPPEHPLAGGETLIVLGEPERVRELSAEVAAGRVERRFGRGDGPRGGCHEVQEAAGRTSISPWAAAPPAAREVELGRLTGILGIVCRGCDAYNEPGAKTCIGCGKPLGAAAEPPAAGARRAVPPPPPLPRGRAAPPPPAPPGAPVVRSFQKPAAGAATRFVPSVLHPSARRRPPPA